MRTTPSPGTIIETVSTQTLSPISMFLTSTTSRTWRSTSPLLEITSVKPLILLGSAVEITMPSTPFSRVCM